MAFWGIEVKPDNPYIYRTDERGRLHVSQATLGSGTSTKKTILQCKVGDKNPIYLCSLLPKRLESCALNLEFEEDDEVTFSVVGVQSVHLSGFFYGGDEEDDDDDDDYDDEYESDLYEENMMGTDSEDDDIQYDFKDGSDYSSDDFDLYPSAPAPSSGVRIEEIVDDEKPANKNDIPKQAKKQKTQLSRVDDNENNNRQIVARAGSGATLSESEDEDGFPITVHGKKSDTSKPETRLEEVNNQKLNEKTPKTNEKDDAASRKKLKGKVESNGQEGEAARKTGELNTLDQPDIAVAESDHKQKKRNKKRKAVDKIESAQDNGTPNPDGTEESPVTETGNDPKSTSEKKKEKKKKQKEQKKGQEGVETPNTEGKLIDKSASVSEEQVEEKAKSLQVRTFPNGLMIEELAMGKPDGKRASPGKKVSVHYIGKLKKNGKIFDSNIGRAPLKFRLGIGQVIKGWDVGINGMRIGDKRRLTIPPVMGYGSKGVGQIPANSWLVFDVELVDVN